MNKTSVVLVAAIASCGAFAKTIDLNGEWNLSKDGAPATAVRVPHDWSIGADFDETKDEASGMLPWKGEGRYSRIITLSKEDAETLKSGGEAYIEFDGVMAQPAGSPSASEFTSRKARTRSRSSRTRIRTGRAGILAEASTATFACESSRRGM